MMNKISNFETKIIGRDTESILEGLAEPEAFRGKGESRTDVMCGETGKGESRTKHKLVTHGALPSPTPGIQRSRFEGRG